MESPSDATTPSSRSGESSKSGEADLQAQVKSLDRIFEGLQLSPKKNSSPKREDDGLTNELEDLARSQEVLRRELETVGGVPDTKDSVAASPIEGNCSDNKFSRNTVEKSSKGSPHVVSSAEKSDERLFGERDSTTRENQRTTEGGNEEFDTSSASTDRKQFESLDDDEEVTPVASNRKLPPLEPSASAALVAPDTVDLAKLPAKVKDYAESLSSNDESSDSGAFLHIPMNYSPRKYFAPATPEESRKDFNSPPNRQPSFDKQEPKKQWKKSLAVVLAQSMEPSSGDQHVQSQRPVELHVEASSLGSGNMDNACSISSPTSNCRGVVLSNMGLTPSRANDDNDSPYGQDLTHESVELETHEPTKPLSLFPATVVPARSLNSAAEGSVGTGIVDRGEINYPEFMYRGYMVPDQHDSASSRSNSIVSSSGLSFATALQPEQLEAESIPSLNALPPYIASPESSDEGLNISRDGDLIVLSHSGIGNRQHSAKRLPSQFAKLYPTTLNSEDRTSGAARSLQAWFCWSSKWSRLGCFILIPACLVAVAAIVGVTVGLKKNSDKDVLDGTAPSLAPNLISPTGTSPVPTLQPVRALQQGATSTTQPTNLFLTPTPATHQPTTDPLVRNLFNLLAAAAPDEGKALRTKSSPQFSAFSWLADTANLSDYLENVSVEKISQRHAMATLYISTNGDSWSNNQSWLSDKDECFWFTRAAGSICDGKGRLQNLQLNYNNLDGSIPLEVGLLTSLESLDLSGGPVKRLTGPIPGTLVYLSLLKELRLPNNELTGIIATEIGTLESIQELDISDNELAGEIPIEISDLKRLTSLNMGGNRLEGSVPRGIGNLKYLSSLRLDRNSLRGDLPRSIGNLRKLDSLNLAENRLTGIPTELGRLTTLRFFSVHDNNITGPLLPEIGEMSNLRSLYLSKNNFHGSLPTELGMLFNLRTLDLSRNGFGGTIRSELGLIASPMRVLKLDHNRLSGTIPSEFQHFKKLNTLFLQNNALTGSMPTPVCRVFDWTFPTVFIDCGNVECPCCNFCCSQSGGENCVCRYADTEMKWRCF